MRCMVLITPLLCRPPGLQPDSVLCAHLLLQQTQACSLHAPKWEVVRSVAVVLEACRLLHACWVRFGQVCLDSSLALGRFDPRVCKVSACVCQASEVTPAYLWKGVAKLDCLQRTTWVHKERAALADRAVPEGRCSYCCACVHLTCLRN
jgi:hypothetical protein